MPLFHVVDPDVGNWEEQNIVYEFEDGWKIVEDRTASDLAELGRITRNCIGASWLTKLLPQPDDEEAVREADLRKTWDKPEYVESRGRDWVEAQIAGALTVPTRRFYRILHLEDSERRPHCAIILGEKNAVDGNACGYASSRDLGQETSIKMGEHEFKLLQATWTTAWMPPAAAEHLPIWWKERAEGQWDEEKFLASVQRYGHIKEKVAA